MTPEQARELLPIIQALAEGKVIKPKPEVIWVTKYKDGTVSIFKSKKTAIGMSVSFVKNDQCEYVAKKFIEAE